MENLYHYVWKTGLGGKEFIDINGSNIEILDPGVHNSDSGPDFFNAKLKINGLEWVGNVEIHVKASDWYRHNHSDNPAYDNVILHVVGVSDKRIYRSDGSLIPQIILTLPEKFFRLYSHLTDACSDLRCASLLPHLSNLNKTDWLETLAVERLQEKAKRVKEIYRQTGNDWEQTCFILLARGLGFGLNGEPFELMAKSLPLRILHHHSDNLFQLEAILFGQSSMLDPSLYMFDEYFQSLCREYYFLSRKYGLKPIRSGLWKYLRTRPQNFPHRRIAFLASAALNGFLLFNKILNSCDDAELLVSTFDMKADGYWKYHFSFDTDARNVPTELSHSSRLLLVINVAIPLLYAYASTTGNLELGEKAMNLLNRLPAENNSIIRQWRLLGIDAKDAANSQAILHLNKEYCEKKKCIYCRFGHHFLRKAALNPG